MGTFVDLSVGVATTVASLKSLDAGGGTMGRIQRTSTFKIKIIKLSQ